MPQVQQETQQFTRSDLADRVDQSLMDRARWRDSYQHRENTYGKLMRLMTRTEFDILLFIGAYPRTTLQEINNSWYFQGVSLSLVKRAVNKFKMLNMIQVSHNTRDKRERLLSLTSNTLKSLKSV